MVNKLNMNKKNQLIHTLKLIRRDRLAKYRRINCGPLVDIYWLAALLMRIGQCTVHRSQLLYFPVGLWCSLWLLVAPRWLAGPDTLTIIS